MHGVEGGQNIKALQSHSAGVKWKKLDMKIFSSSAEKKVQQFHIMIISTVDYTSEYVHFFYVTTEKKGKKFCWINNFYPNKVGQL